jgi:hypothetical protein
MFVVARMEHMNSEEQMAKYHINMVIFKVRKIMVMANCEGWNGVWLRVRWWVPKTADDDPIAGIWAPGAAIADNIAMVARGWQRPQLIHWGKKESIITGRCFLTDNIRKLIYHDTRWDAREKKYLSEWVNPTLSAETQEALRRWEAGEDI